MQPRLTHGFIEHGHARGEPALIVECSPGMRCTPEFLIEHALPGERIHFFLTHVDAHTAAYVSVLARMLMNCGLYNLSVCFRPGDRIDLEVLAYQSIMRVTEDDTPQVTASALDPNTASVSVHFWPGSPMLELFATHLAAPRGLFLVLDREDLGHAKVYLRGAPQTRWRIVHTYPLNDLEAAEFEEMLRERFESDLEEGDMTEAEIKEMVEAGEYCNPDGEYIQIVST